MAPTTISEAHEILTAPLGTAGADAVAALCRCTGFVRNVTVLERVRHMTILGAGTMSNTCPII